MSFDEIKPLPKVPDPRHLEEHGIAIPAQTPTAISIPNPWRPAQNGNGRVESVADANGSAQPAKSK